jgi:hypothetical protein
MRHYHSLLPQLDIIATQWGVDPDDNLERDIGLLRSEGEISKRQKVLDEQLRNQVQDARMQQVGGQGQNNPVVSGSSASSRLINQAKSSNQPPSEAVDRLTKQNKEEVRKRRDLEQMLSKIEEDYRLFGQQHSVSATSSAAGGVAPRPQVPLLVLPENPLPHPRPPGSERDSVQSTFGPESNASPDVGMQLLQVLRDATSNAGGIETHRGISGRPHDENFLQVTTETMGYFTSRDGAC